VFEAGVTSRLPVALQVGQDALQGCGERVAQLLHGQASGKLMAEGSASKEVLLECRVDRDTADDVDDVVDLMFKFSSMAPRVLRVQVRLLRPAYTLSTIPSISARLKKGSLCPLTT